MSKPRLSFLPGHLLDKTGMIRTYDLFMAYAPGYFQLEVLACDEAGNSDMATVSIYILRDDQRVKIMINDIPENVRLYQDEFVKLLSNITGAIVNTDDVQVRGAHSKFIHFLLFLCVLICGTPATPGLFLHLGPCPPFIPLKWLFLFLSVFECVLFEFDT